MTMQLIGWALVHSLWQVALVAFVVAGLFALMRHAPPTLRYAVGMAGLGLMLALPVVTAFRTTSAVSRSFSSTALSTGTTGSETLADAERGRSGQLSSGLSAPAASASATPSATVTTDGAKRAAETTPRPVGVESLSAFAAGVRAIANRYVPLALPWMVAAWLLGLLVLSARLIGGITRTRRLTTHSTSRAEERVVLAVRRVSRTLGVDRLVRVLQSTSIDVPMVVGALRPIVVVPASLITGMTPWQLEMLLAHEIAHIRRYDYLGNLAQTVVETLLFYHPAARWLSERVRDERENCCDDIAVAACGDPAAYTATLLALEESRTDGLVFAAAATGGSLVKRARRLLVRESNHSDLGPRWIAGLITIVAALFTATQAVGGTVRTAFVREASVSPPRSIASDTISRKRDDGWPDASRAAPERVLRAPAGGSLAERWRWAEKQGRNLPSRSYWIGYVVAAPSDESARYYFDANVPVRIGESTFSGRMQLGDGPLSDFRFAGAALAPLVGNHAPRSTAIFMLVDRGNPSRVERIHLSSFALPVHFDRAPLLWLDSAGDSESIERMRSYMLTARSEDIRRELVAATGVHQDSRLVVPFLIGLLQSRTETEGVRREAAEWLGKKPDPRSIAALVRAARTDQNEGVRHDAIEAFGHMKYTAASDTLIALGQSLESEELRKVAIEALGHRADARALEYLTRMARSGRSPELRIHAIEAIGSLPDGRGFATITDIARNDPSSEIRRKAVEELAHAEPPSRAMEVLRQIIRSDPDPSVQSEAAETIAEVNDPRTVGILTELAKSGSDLRVQLEATESLGETAAPREAMAALRELARAHESLEVRKKALETIGDFHEEQGSVEALVQVARSRESIELRLAAIEALGEAAGERGLAELSTLARGREELELRLKAIETYASSARPTAAVTMLKAIIAADGNEDVRMQALESLSEVDNDIAWKAVAEIARSSADAGLRARAVELIRER